MAHPCWETLHSMGTRAVGLFLAAALAVLAATPGDAQVRVKTDVAANRAPAAPAVSADETVTEVVPDDLAQGLYLTTDFEAERLLQRAREYLDGPEPQLLDALGLLRRLLAEMGGAISSEDGWVYRPVRDLCEQMILRLGPEALALYRTNVDGEARALLGPDKAPRDAEAMRTVERTYFLSSVGDEAAYRLACLALDEGRDAEARRLLARILNGHPDPSMPRADLLVRLAVANRRSGDAEGAREAWTRLREAGFGSLGAEAVAAVEAALASPPDPTPSDEPHLWPTPRGLFARVPPALAAEPEPVLVEGWIRTFDLLPPGYRFRNPIHPKKTLAQEGNAHMRDLLAGRWQQTAWFPSGEAVVAGDRVLVKSTASLHCLDVRTGKVLWETEPGDEGEVVALAMGRTAMTPSEPHAALQFADRVGAAVRVAGDRVYHVGEQHYDKLRTRRSVRIRVVVNGKARSVEPRRGNRLAALDLETGQELWSVGRTEDGPLGSVHFLGPPVPCGDRLVALYETEGEMHLVALRPEDGAVAWKTFLCAEIAGQKVSGVRCGMAVRGSTVYVATGQGVVFAVDAIDGRIHWASRYARTKRVAGGGPARQSDVVGWDVNYAWLDGPRLVVLPSDTRRILVFDAAEGRTLAAHEAPGAVYCLGFAEGSIFAGSPQGVRRIGVEDGRTVWSAEWKPGTTSYGRGFLSPDAVCVPRGGQVVRLDREDGRERSATRASLEEDLPVGNLFSDGQTLLAYGLGTVYALEGAGLRLARVGEEIAEFEAKRAALDAPLAEKKDRATGLARELEAIEQRAGVLKSGTAILVTRRKQVEEELEGLDPAPPPGPDDSAPTEAEAAAARKRHARREALREKLSEIRERLMAFQDEEAEVTRRRETLEKDVAKAEKAVEAFLRRRVELAREIALGHRDRGRLHRARDELAAAAEAYGTAARMLSDRQERAEAQWNRVTCLLALADREPDRARALAAEARETAGPAGGWLLATRRLIRAAEDEGELTEALDLALELVMDRDEALSPMIQGIEAWHVQPAAAGIAEVERLREAHGDVFEEALAARADQALAAARKRGTFVALQRVARCFDGLPQAVEAGLAAASLAGRKGPAERGEVILRAMARSDDARMAAAGMAALARTYEDAGWRRQARDGYRVLARRFGDVPVPGSDGPTTGSALAEARLAALSAPQGPDPREPVLPEPPYRFAWSSDQRMAYQLVHDSRFGAEAWLDRSEFLASHYISSGQGHGGQLECRRIHDGRQLYVLPQGKRPGYTRASIEGHVAVLVGPTEVMAMGLVSGKRLWSYDAPEAMTRAGNFHASTSASGPLHRGRTIVQLNPDALAVLDVATGETLWQRRMRRRILSGILSAGPYVVLVFGDGGSVWVCDARTGFRVSRFTLPEAPSRSGAHLEMTSHGLVVYGFDEATSTYGLSLRELSSGRVRWRAETQLGNVQKMYVLSPDLVCLVDFMHAVEVWDVARGERVHASEGGPGRGGVGEAALGPDGRILYVGLYQHGAGQRVRAVDLATREVLAEYHIEASTYRFRVPIEVFTYRGDLLPFIERVRYQDEQGRNRATHVLRFMRKADGEIVPDLEVGSSTSRSGGFDGLRQIRVQGGALLLETISGVYAYVHDDEPSVPGE